MYTCSLAQMHCVKDIKYSRVTKAVDPTLEISRCILWLKSMVQDFYKQVNCETILFDFAFSINANACNDANRLIKYK